MFILKNMVEIYGSNLEIVDKLVADQNWISTTRFGIIGYYSIHFKVEHFITWIFCAFNILWHINKQDYYINKQGY